MQYTIKKKLRPTCTAHYLGKGYPHQCKSLHGHNYSYVVEVTGNALNEHDMLVDFSVLKTVCDNWLQNHWDHTTVFSDFQTEAIEFWKKMGWKYEVFPVSNANTTAENMSRYLAKLFYTELRSRCGFDVTSVTMHVWETEGSEAVYTFDGGEN